MSIFLSTPVKDHAQSVSRFSATIFLAKDFRLQFANETLGMFYGPMPVEMFLDKFLPATNATPDSVQNADFSKVPTYEGALEKDMYDPLASGMNEHCKPFWFMISADNSTSGEEVKTRPDIGMIDPSHWRQPTDRVTRESTTKLRQNVAPAPLKTTGPYKWGICELSCEVKRSSNDDAFEDGNTIGALDKLTGGGASNKGQLVTYYKEQASRQHRTFIFQIFVFGSYARLLRWDRSGAVVTRKFNYKEQPELLSGFLWRYSQLSRPDRGWDPSATLAEAKDVDLFKTSLKKLLQGNEPATSSPGASKTIARLLTAANARKTLEGDYPTHAIHLSPSKNWDFHTTLIVGRPIYEPLSPFGRATRGYLAYDRDHKEFRFLKDIWRIDHRYLEPDPSDNTDQPKRQYRSEDDFYTLMKTVNVPQVGLPVVYYAGDVKNEDGSVQKTQTNELPLDDPAINEWRKPSAPLRAHIHHHILQELLCPLHTFSSSKELVGITRDVFKTLKAVKDEAGILHRDLSIGNVMFRVNDNDEIEGVLNDWDNNGPEPEETQKQRRVGISRTGTWQFMAIDLLEEPGTRNEFWHDMESGILWVPLYMALRYMAHNHRDTPDDMDMFDLVELPQKAPTEWIAFNRGGSAKRKFLADHKKNLNFESAPFDRLLKQLLNIYSTYYAHRTLPPGPLYDELVGNQLKVLNNWDSFVEMLDTAYKSPDWPESEKIEDQFPPRTANNKKTARQKVAWKAIVQSDPLSQFDSQNECGTMTGVAAAGGPSEDAKALAGSSVPSSQISATSGPTDSGIESSPSESRVKANPELRGSDPWTLLLYPLQAHLMLSGDLLRRSGRESKWLKPSNAKGLPRIMRTARGRRAVDNALVCSVEYLFVYISRFYM